ncbi:tyrosine-type recombinase/integrase [Porticoccaceae bacterium]|nr:tyrosine-type recombinase/integrase [Porticoccaceae bacterium]
MAKNITAKGLEKLIRENIPKRYALGNSLYLDISGGSAVFTFRYKVKGKQRKKTLKPYHSIHNNLGHARTKALELKAKVRQGIDLKEEEELALHRKQLELKELKESKELQSATFENLAFQTIEYLQHEWTNHKTAKQWESSLRQYAFPIIGKMPVSGIERKHILKILEPIWFDKTETADRVRRRIEAVLRRAISDGLRAGDNPAAWRGGLEHRLPSAEKTKNKRAAEEERHHSALPYRELPKFMAELARMDGMGARALELLILNANRSDEVLAATWHEFDLDERVWTIPARRMKGRASHTIPLSEQSIQILMRLADRKTSDYVFPNTSSGKSLSQAGMSAVLKRMGRAGQITVHGFRSTFRDYIAEKTDLDGAIAEHALAHKIKDKAIAAYQRGAMMDKRRLMMQRYANYAYQTGEKVVQLRV